MTDSEFQNKNKKLKAELTNENTQKNELVQPIRIENSDQ